MKDQTTAQLLAKVARAAAPDLEDIRRLAEVIRRQDARIAALEAARRPAGPPLEGTGPLPLETRMPPGVWYERDRKRDR